MKKFAAFGKFVLASGFLLAIVAPAVTQNKAGEQDSAHQFCCAVNCMDGRVQDVVSNFVKVRHRVKYVDMITEAGPNKKLADNPKHGLGKAIVEDIKERLEISMKHHGSTVVAIVGHDGCAGNPADKQDQIRHLREAKKTVESFGLGIEIVLLWVEKDFKTIHLVR